jgi:acetyl-CoA carboxylase biotin carboxyl carrier protein
VLRVEVEAGAVVDEGDALVLLESMKMEIPVFTAVAGVVRAVKVSSGDVVQDGDVLVEIETS